jgi:uncharacterized membrane protein
MADTKNGAHIYDGTYWFKTTAGVTLLLGIIMGLVMAANVWMIIWPNQQKVLGLVEADDAAKAKAGRTALIASRTNTLLSIPMLYAMTTYQTLGS